MKKFDRANALSGDIIDMDLAARWLVNSVVVNRDLSMGIGWKVSFPYLPTAGEGAKDALHQSFRAMMHSIPAHIDLQVIFSQHHDGSSIVDAIKQGTPQDQPILREIMETKAQLIADSFASNRLRLLEGYIILVRKNTIPPAKLQKRIVADKDRGDTKLNVFTRLYEEAKLSLFGPEEGYQYTSREYDEARKDLMGVADAVDHALKEMALKPDLLGNQEVLDLFYRHWNPQSYDRGSRARVYRPGEGLPLTDYFLRSPWELQPDGLFVSDGMHHAIITVRTPAESMHFTQFDGLMLASGHHRMKIIVNIQHGDVNARKKRIKDQLPSMRTQVQKNPDFQTALQDMEQELVSLGSDSEKVWQATHVIHVWGSTPEQVKQSIQAIKAYGESNDGLILSEETHATWEYWRDTQPFWTRGQDRYREHTYNSTQMVTQLPMGGQFPGFDGTLGATFETTAGSVYNLFFHGQQFNNYNALVMGGSGSGKSFLVNDILAQMSRHNPSVVIVDLGGSFRSMCMAVGGQYIDMDLKNPSNRINPLFLPATVELDEEMLSTMVTFIEKLIVDQAIEKRLRKEQVAIVEQALVQTFLRAEGKEIFLSNVKETLGTFSGGEALAQRLSPWTGSGRYAKLFDGPSLLSPNGRFTVFDLSKVVDNVDLCSVMFATIIQQVAALGAANPSQVKFLVFDEAWKMLEDELTASFLVGAFRTLRKVKFSVIGISQGIEEFAKTKNKTAIINNLAHQIILKQSETSAVMVAEELGLNSAEAAIITKLQSRSGQYSQSLIIQRMANGQNRSVITINRPSPLNYWCCTTNPDDRGAIQEYKSRGLSHLEALVQLSRDYPHGYVRRAG